MNEGDQTQQDTAGQQDIGTATNTDIGAGAPGNVAGSDPVDAPSQPGEGAVSNAASSSASDTASSADSAQPGASTEVGQDDPQAGDAGKVNAAASTAASAGASDVNMQPASSTADAPSATEGDLGNVGADGVVVDAGGSTMASLPSANATSTESMEPSTTDHPAIPHLQALRRKIESGEAIIMAELLSLIHRIEESL